MNEIIGRLLALGNVAEIFSVNRSRVDWINLNPLVQNAGQNLPLLRSMVRTITSKRAATAQSQGARHDAAFA